VWRACGLNRQTPPEPIVIAEAYPVMPEILEGEADQPEESPRGESADDPEDQTEGDQPDRAARRRTSVPPRDRLDASCPDRTAAANPTRRFAIQRCVRGGYSGVDGGLRTDRWWVEAPEND
jgi:hypothetical protein